MEIQRKISSLLKNYRKRGEEEEVSRSFLENGSMLLEELITSSNGRYGIPIRNFSVEDILRATNNFDTHNLIGVDSFYILYKGFLKGRLILVKKFAKERVLLAIRDITIAAQMVIHKNVLKLLGCCLEDEATVLVYEYAGERFLSDCAHGELGGDNRPLSWKCRLRAANQIANVLAYLHTALYRPVVHRDVNPRNFLIDQHGVVKLFDFSVSISIPLGKSWVADRVVGTTGFLDPEYMHSSFVTEKCDVYSFGIVLLVLLTGRSPTLDHGEPLGLVEVTKSFLENDQFNEIMDPIILEGGGGTEQELQLQDFLALALRCTQYMRDDRPEMIDVAKELRRLERSVHPYFSSASIVNTIS